MNVDHENKNPDSPLDLDATGETAAEGHAEETSGTIREFAPAADALDSPIKVGG